MNARKLISMVALLGLSFGIMATSVPEDKIATLRLAPLNVEPTPPAMQQVINTDVKQVRNYPMQPPVIPHKIDGYQIDLKVNKCMQCHARTSTGHINPTRTQPLAVLVLVLDQHAGFEYEYEYHFIEYEYDCRIPYW